MHMTNWERRMAVQNHIKKMLETHGWVLHTVYDREGDNPLNGLANIHTEGLPENFSHKNIQVVLPVSAQVIYPIVYGMMEKIKTGYVFEPNQRNSEVLEGADVYFQEIAQGNETYLRMIMPDREGRLPNEEGCTGVYTRQFEQLPV